MKNLRVYEMSKWEMVIYNRLTCMSLALFLASNSLTGCSSHELAADEYYDIVEQNAEGFGAVLTQKLEVPGEIFKLITDYSCDPSSEREWRITSDKFLYLKVYTEGLLEDTKVWIDNVHIDTSIKSKYAAFDGILQDSMDDHVHNSQMIGFPIGNEIAYYGVNAIEGCNETFIQGTMSGYNGYYSGSTNEKMFTESDYMGYGVYANKIQVVYDLLIQGPNDLTPRNVSVSTDFIVPVTTTEIEFEKGDTVKTKTYGQE